MFFSTKEEQSSLLVWPFPTVVELMSGELVAGAEALAAALTGKGFLPSQPNIPHVIPKNIHCKRFSQRPQRLMAPALTNPVCLQR